MPWFHLTTYSEKAPLNKNLAYCKKKSITKCSSTTWNYLQNMKKRTGNSKTGSKNIQSGHWNGIWHRKICNARNDKWQTTSDWWNGTTKSRQDQNARRKRERTYTWASRRLTPSNMRWWKKKLRKEHLRRTRKLLEPWLYFSLNTRVRFWSGPEKNISKWTKEQES